MCIRDRIIPKNLLNIPKNGFLNVHASLLPKWRGAAPIQRSIMNLDRKSGISIMKINENFEKKQIKSFSLNFDKKLIRHIQKLKSPDKRIKKAMIYFAKTGGKRIRPFLLCRMGLYLNIRPKILDDFALSIECVHLHSLIHDDLPSMDNDDYRRGKLTVHKKFDEATAVLAGDMFQVLSVKTLVESKNLSDNQKIKSIQMLSKANGLEGLIAGQSMDIYMKKNSTIKDIETMHLLKTGALLSLIHISEPTRPY